MTTTRRIMTTCSVCGRSSEHMAIMSTNAFGSPDLDLRPPKMRRSTMSLWHQVCPHCGYVAPGIDAPTSATASWLASEAFRDLDGALGEDAPQLAIDFYRQHKIELLDGHPDKAALSLLHAAWACDDAGLADATFLRLRCVALLDEATALGIPSTPDAQLMRADVMRRAGLFDQLLEQYREQMFESEPLNQLMAFELELARAHDDGCHTVAEATS